MFLQLSSLYLMSLLLIPASAASTHPICTCQPLPDESVRLPNVCVAEPVDPRSSTQITLGLFLLDAQSFPLADVPAKFESQASDLTLTQGAQSTDACGRLLLTLAAHGAAPKGSRAIRLTVAGTRLSMLLDIAEPVAELGDDSAADSRSAQESPAARAAMPELQDSLWRARRGQPSEAGRRLCTDIAGFTFGRAGEDEGQGTAGPASSPISRLGGGAGGRQVGDWDADGWADLATVHHGAGEVHVAHQRGAGRFPSAERYKMTGLPTSLVTADLNGNGHPDLIVADGNSLTVLTNRGDGTFTARRSYALPQPPHALVAGDLRAAGHVDILVLHLAATPLPGISHLVGDGTGGLRLVGSYDLGASPSGLTLGDFDGDGMVEVAVVHSEARLLSILQQNGHGRFTTVRRVPLTALAPEHVAAADLDGNGALDLAIADRLGNGVLLLRNDGHGQFRADAELIPTGPSPGFITFGDFNDDGHVDLAVTHTRLPDTGLLLGRGDGSFAPSFRLALFTAPPISCPATPQGAESRRRRASSMPGGAAALGKPKRDAS